VHNGEYVHLVPKPSSVLSCSFAHTHMDLSVTVLQKGLSFNKIPLVVVVPCLPGDTINDTINI